MFDPQSTDISCLYSGAERNVYFFGLPKPWKTVAEESLRGRENGHFPMLMLVLGLGKHHHESLLMWVQWLKH